MRTSLVAALALLVLGACRDDVVSLPAPVEMTAESVGYYCQMHMLEHDGPKGQAHLAGLLNPLFFSQVRDAIAYLRMPEQSHGITAIYVNDMGAPGATWERPGAANWILVESAHYVVGSTRAGGMGAPELVPFSDPALAEAFAAVHGGTVMRLADIPDSAVLTPVDLPPTGPGAAEDGTAEEDFQERLRRIAREQES